MTVREPVLRPTEEYVWISKALNIDIFTSVAHPILRRLAQELNVTVTLAGSEGTGLEDEPYIQAIYDAVGRKVAGIMIHGWGVPEEVAAINAAIEQGIPVITVDSDVPTSKRLAHVGTDWFRMGAAMADQLAGLVGNSGKVLYLGNAALSNIQAGFQGFALQMRNYPAIEILESQSYTSVDADEAVTLDLFRRHPDIKGIAGFESHSGIGVAKALDDLGLAGKVKVICVDAQEGHIEQINNGTIQVAFAQRRERFTYQALQMLYDYNHSSETVDYASGTSNIATNVDTGFVIVTRWNAASFQDEFNLDANIDRLKLTRRLALMSNVIESSGQMAIAVDRSRQIIYANPSSTHLSGFSEAQLKGMNAQTLFNLSFQQQVAIEECAVSGQSVYFETSVRCAQGQALPVQLTVSSLQRSLVPNALVLIATDISELKRAEVAIQQSEERLKQAIRVANIGIFEHNHLTDELYWSPEQRQIFKWGADEQIGVEVLNKMIHPEDAHRFVDAFNKAHDPKGDGLFDLEYRIIDREGAVHWTNNRSITLFEGEDHARHPVRTIGALMDVTEQKLTEAALKKKYDDETRMQAFFKKLHEISIDLTAIDDLDTFYRAVVELGLMQLDIDRLGLYIYDPQHNLALGTYGTDDKGQIQKEDHLQIVMQPPGGMWHAMNSPDRFFYEEEGPLYHNNYIVGQGARVAVAMRHGTRLLGWLTADNLLRHRPLTIQYRDALAQYGMLIAAILARKQVEAQKQESERMLQTILDTIPTRVFWKDQNYRLIGCNQRFVEDAGVTSATELIGRNNDELALRGEYAWKSEAGLYHADDKKVMETGVSLIGYEEPQTRTDGKVYWLRTTKMPLRDAKGRTVGVLGAYEDITERKLSEMALEAKRQEEQQFLEYLKVLHEVSRELTVTETLNDFYQKTVELALKRLKIDRLAMWLYDATENKALGTYGTDAEGNVRSEVHIQFTIEPFGPMWGALQNPDRFYFVENTALAHDLKQVGTGWNAAVTLRHGDRILGWLTADNLIHGEPISQPKLEILAQYGMFIAATLSRKQAEVELQINEERLRQAVRVGKLGVFDHEHQTNKSYFSPEHRSIYGWGEDDVVTLDKLINLVHIEDRKRLMESVQRASDPAGDGMLLDVEYRITNLQGEQRWLSRRSRTFFEGDGDARHPVRTVGAISDITERKHADFALEAKRQAEQEFQHYLKVLHEISRQLTMTETLDEFYMLTVKFGLERLGFDRLAFWLYDAAENKAIGTYGTDTSGKLHTEFHIQFPIEPRGAMWGAIQIPERFYFVEAIDLVHDMQSVGKGWNAAVALRHGDNVLGWLTADNLIHARPITQAELEILAQYGLFIAATLARKQTEAALKISEERLRQAVGVGNIGIYDYDPVNNTMYMSPELYHFVGWSIDETVSAAKMLQAIHPEDRAVLQAQFRWLTNNDDGDDSFDLESRVYDRDGNTHWLSSRSRSFFDGEGAARRAVRTIGAIMDITERKMIEELLIRYNKRLSVLREIDRQILSARSTREIINSVLEPLAELVPCEWVSVVLYNEDITTEQVYEWRPTAEIKVDVLHSQPVVENDVLRRLKAGESTISPDLKADRIQHAKLAEELVDEGMRAAMANPMMIHGKLVGVLAFASKQTSFFTADHQEVAEAIADQVAIALQQVRLNEQISRQNAELEQRVAERTQELQEANEEIKNFAYIVSHDLRAPLVNLKGFAAELSDSLKIVKKGCDEALPFLAVSKRDAITQALELDIPEAIHYIESSVSNMDTFTKAILKLSRLGRLQLEIVNVDTRSVVEKKLESLGYQISQRNIKVSLGALPTIAADLVSMEQIFGNILANAVAYLVPGRPAEIDISAWQNPTETIFRIRDNGRGIAKEDMDKVFAPFRRAGKQDVPGEGMGLAYVQTLVRRHGGRIWCESQPNIGTTFCFTISNHLMKDL